MRRKNTIHLSKLRVREPTLNVFKFNNVLFLLVLLTTCIFLTSAMSKNSLKQLNSQIILLQSQLIQNFKLLNSKIDTLTANLTRVSKQLDTNTGAIVAAIGRINALETSLADANSRILKLESINKIWQSNFGVVNRTFAELRQKVKFVIPVFKIIPTSLIFVGKRG